MLVKFYCLNAAHELLEVNAARNVKTFTPEYSWKCSRFIDILKCILQREEEVLWPSFYVKLMLNIDKGMDKDFSPLYVLHLSLSYKSNVFVLYTHTPKLSLFTSLCDKRLNLIALVVKMKIFWGWKLGGEINIKGGFYIYF